jgi:protein-S-isoprenylcysteine O-methyltransferase Ste14
MVGRIAGFVYGVLSYAVFFATFLYAIGFIGNIAVPKSIDGGPEGSLLVAALWNSALLAVFALQHSVMARPAFKRAWTRIVPEPLERSTYVLFSSLALILLFWRWRPMGGVLWDVAGTATGTALQAVCAIGFLTVLVTTFLINHFDLFGLRQSWLYLLGKPYTHVSFRTPGPYRVVRHPLYVGWLLAFWATPTMTVAHLLFALATTAYILVAIQLEERDLIDLHGEDYRRYRASVPMLLPRLARRERAVAAVRSGEAASR